MTAADRVDDRADAPSPHWADLGESTFAAGIWFMYGVHRVFGRLPFLLILYPVVAYYWATRGLARRASMQYLQRIEAARGAIGHVPGMRDGLRHFLCFADTLLDKMLAMSGRYRLDQVRIEGGEVVLDMLRRGQGGLFVTAHIGCLELCQAAATRHAGMRLTVLVHTLHAQRFSRVLKRLDPQGAVELIQVTEITPATAMLLNERVQRGEFVAMAGDRIPVQGGRVTHAPFLGAPAAWPIGPYVLALLLKAPLLMLSCVREPAGYVVHIERLVNSVHLPRAGRDKALAGYAAVFARRLEDLLAHAPYAWFNFFPFWDQRPAAPTTAPHDIHRR